MNKEDIYICDLTHTAQCISSEFFPYAIGLITSYLKKHSRYSNRINVKIFKFPEEISSTFKAQKKIPKIVAFSNYIWNSDISNNIAKIIKKQFPDTIIIFGGPNFSEELELQEQWLRERPWVDFYIRLEGEIAFTELVDSLLENNGINDVEISNLPSLCYIDKLNQFNNNKLSDRIRELDIIPSPYTLGILDSYFDTTLWPIFETNRGCPFKCTFCTEGYSYYAKVNKRSNKLIIDELQYIAKQDPVQQMMFVADSNF